MAILQSKITVFMTKFLLLATLKTDHWTRHNLFPQFAKSVLLEIYQTSDGRFNAFLCIQKMSKHMQSTVSVEFIGKPVDHFQPDK